MLYFYAVKKIIIATAFLICLLSAFAHEYILLAYEFRVHKGDNLEMHLFVADGFNVQLERPMQTSITKKFELLNQNGVTDLLAVTSDGALPIINSKVDFEGLGLIQLERDYSKITLPTAKFLDYLNEDHIEYIAALIDTSKKEQNERYTRYIKALVQSGKVQDDTLYKTITGQNFEIILLQNPYLLHKGNTITAQVFFMGKPLANKIITARNRIGNEPAIALTSRTNNNGICSFKIARSGDWFIHATHMIACADKKEADWESFWTSYSFGIDQ